MSLAKTYLDLFRRNPALTRLLAGEFISGIGDWLYLVAVLVVVYAASDSAILLGIVGAARILPYVILSVPAGIVADRFDRRTVLLVTDVARGILMLVLAAAVIVDAPTLVIIGLAILAACFSTFFGPAIAALVPALVDERDLGPANSAWATLDNVAFIIGPALAGLLLASGGLTFAFLLNAASFAVVAVVLWRLPVVSDVPVTENDEAEATESGGWRELVRPLAGPFLLDSVTSFVGGGLGVLTVVIAIDVLDAGEAGTGYLNAATGVGGVVAGIAGGALLARRLGVPLLMGGAVGGIGLAWLAIAGNLVTAMAAIAVAVAGLLLLDIVNTTLIQRIVPDDLRGRAIGVLQATSSVLMAAGSLALPILADATSVAAVLVASAILTAIGVIGSLLLSGERGAPEPLPAGASRLVEHSIFAGLPAARLETAARQLEPMPVEADAVVVRQGDAADRFYLIDEGTFRVTQTPDGGGAETALRDLGPGDLFGEIGLLRGTPRTATVRSVTPGLLYTLDADAFRELVGSGPGLSTRMLDLYRGAITRA
ncbi:MAG: MFS transporter [Candidatus Limnocylindria bacterium]